MGKPLFNGNQYIKKKRNKIDRKMTNYDLVAQLGTAFIVVEVSPKFEYIKNEITGRQERTENIVAYTYDVLMRDRNYKGIRVSVEGKAPIIDQMEINKRGAVKVSFEGLTCNPYVSQNKIMLSFKADMMRILKKEQVV